MKTLCFGPFACEAIDEETLFLHEAGLEKTFREATLAFV